MYDNRGNSRGRQNADNHQQVVVQHYKIVRFNKYAKHNYAYYAVPVSEDGRPIGKSERIKFTNIFAPEELKDELSFNPKDTIIVAQIRIFKTVKLVVLWRFLDNHFHNEALCIQEFRLSYRYRFKASAIEAFNEYNDLISKQKGWKKDAVLPITIRTIEEDPWYLIEWEKKIQDLGISRDSRKHFNLNQCDAIGISLNLDPLTNSRVLQYCIASMQELCYKFGSTIVYFEPYLKHTTQNINSSEMNIKSKIVISKPRLVTISKERNDYFFIGRTELHNTKLFIASKEMWDAQNYIVERMYQLSGDMVTPYYAERELLLGYIKGKQPIRKMGLDVIKHVVSKMLWFNPATERIIEHFMKDNHMRKIDDVQRKAIHTSLNEKVSIVSGGPGRGKSSCVLKGILYTINSLYTVPTFDTLFDAWNIGGESANKELKKEKVLEMIGNSYISTGKKVVFVHVVSFTGKAVSRVKEILVPDEMYHMFDPMTIHRLLGKCSTYSWLRDVSTIIIVDEVSMVSDILFFKLLRAFNNIKKIVLLGDVDQLPPIQPGNTLKQLIESRCLPVTRLIKNYRQGPGSGLPDIADKIIGRQSKGNGMSRVYGGWDHALNIPTKKNKSNVTTVETVFGTREDNNDCEVYEYTKYHSEDDIFDDIAAKVVELRKSCDLFVDCAVLTAKRIEVAKLNAKLQAAFMPDLEEIQEAHETVQHFYEGIKFTFVTGDRVMYLQNNYDQDMFNGDIARVVGVNRYDKQLTLKFPDSTTEKTGDIDDIQPAYGYTCHKAQGSEYKIVIIYISNAAQLLHVDQWLYTAFTRAKQKVYIFGYSSEIISTVLREMKYRRTFLKHRLQLQFSHTLKDLLKDELQDCPK